MKRLLSCARASFLAIVRKNMGFSPLSERAGVVAVGDMAMMWASLYRGREALAGPEQMGPMTAAT